jgi:RNA polymerase sigma-70 factor (ECF subfamily)
MVQGAASRAGYGADVELRFLVAHAQEGDRDALEELYLLHFDRIYGYLYVTVGNRDDAEDLTTQTFLRMLESIGRFRWRSAPFSAWLLRIAHNLAVDHFRARQRMEVEPEKPEREESSVEVEALGSIAEFGMLELIDRLSAEQRQVLTLKFLFGFGNAEAAGILGKTEGAVKSLQHRALAQLEKQLVRS